MQKLHLGCGSRIIEGYTNIDIVATLPEVCEHSVLDLSFIKDKTIDEVVMFYLLEHLTYEEVSTLLYHISKKLVSGGIVKILVPDFDQITRHYASIRDSILNLQLLNIEIYIYGQEGGHKTIWNEVLLRHYLTCENFFKVNKIISEVGSKNLGIYIEAERTSDDYYRLMEGGDVHKKWECQ